MLAALFILISAAIGAAFIERRSLGIVLFFLSLACCALMLYHLATSELQINW